MSRPTDPVLSPARQRQWGASLVELIMFIVVIGAGLAGILGVWRVTAQGSADPLIQKQALAIAEAYLEEALGAPFTYCDPDDANAATAQSTGPVNPADPTVCAAVIEAVGAEAGETRGSGTTPFDNVNDYNGLSGAPTSIDGTAIGGLSAYQVSVTVTQEALSTVGSAQSLRVSVAVTGPANTTVQLDGYRTRYAPNALP